MLTHVVMRYEKVRSYIPKKDLVQIFGKVPGRSQTFIKS